jgi:hypothetical protein
MRVVSHIRMRVSGKLIADAQGAVKPVEEAAERALSSFSRLARAAFE